MAWIKNGEIPAPILIQMIREDTITGDVRITLKSVENIVFLATKDNLINVIDDTVKPTDIFEIWTQEKTQET